MGALLIAVIYLAFVSLGLPDSLLGSGWPTMQADFDVPSSYAGYVSMSISFMTIISALIAPYLIRKIRTQWIVVLSIMLTVIGLIVFSFSTQYWMLFLFVVPYGLGAGSVDSALNNYVAKHCSSSVMNFLHCFYGVGAMISPYIMSLALSHAHWNEGYRWTAYMLHDQSIVAGIGNIYSDEILYASHIYPEKPCNTLSDGEWQRLAVQIPAIIAWAIKANEISPEEYLAGKGKEYRNTPHLKTYGREGKPCPVCGKLFVRIVVGGRSSCYCPECQKNDKQICYTAFKGANKWNFVYWNTSLRSFVRRTYQEPPRCFM